MRSKHTVNPQRASAANKPFMTEYRLSFRDPTANMQKRKNAKSNSKKNQPKEIIAPVKPIEPVKREEKAPVETNIPSTSLNLPAMLNNAAASNSLEAYRRRRRLLAAEHKQQLHQRYNVITGSIIEQEASSGFKEGRRAVITTFSHIDTITNARSPGYNIITGHDALSGKSPEEIQKIYGNATVSKAH